ncbi:2'-5' RNA ligase family protein [Anabaena sp. UHCC 0451]|uniref:2'-5' RNA ligase family protein n=1 Tax=Anabaena sp. UHCC 0451 TaxID=2055235 RepID=UPI002B219927|nr:2'-5' RNA ligase family protein [Anabaena sp. UHCC 0451]MEA5577491.1 2'-5' RNA ligase family protein [Anabaena sp. UHCC 0451]
MNRFFIAILPPQNIQDYANKIKQHFFDNYASRGAQNSPPHITLKPPFLLEQEQVSILEIFLVNFAQNQNSLPITIDGFAAFLPRVVYMNVIKNQALLKLQSDLINDVENNLGIKDKGANNHTFTPHLTVARKDLKKSDFYKAWDDFKERQVYFEFVADNITLLLNDGKKWNVKSEFSLLSNF